MDFSRFWFANSRGNPIPFPVGNSLRFRGAQHLSWTPAAVGNRRTSTFSGWFKWAAGAVGEGPFFSATGYTRIGIDSGGFDHIWFQDYDGSLRFRSETSASYRDPAAWFHVVGVVDTTNATASERIRIYVNGEKVTSFATQQAPAQNFDTEWSNTVEHKIGSDPNPFFFNGYMAEVHFIDGTALDPTAFGEFNDYGVWVPSRVTGVTYGTNGFYLDFSNPNNIGADRSGNGNNFTPSGFELANTSSGLYDSMEDSPTDNFSTWNPVEEADTWNAYGVGMSSANLQHGTNSSWNTFTSTGGFSSGRWYYELQVTGNNQAGIVASDWAGTPGVALHDFGALGYNRNDGRVYQDKDSGTPYGNTFTGTHTLGIAVDADNDRFYFAIDNTWQNSANPANGTGGFNITLGSKPWRLAASANQCTGQFVNFGQRPFVFAPPVGFEPLSTAGMPRVDITNPSEHFQTILSESPPVYPEPAARGDAYGGGFYAGRIKDGNAVYNIIVAPASEGNLNGEFPGTTRWDRYASAKPLAYSETYGGTATFTYGDGGNNSFVFDWAAATSTGPNAGTVDETNTAGTGIGGYNDWYVPAYKELELIYRTFKPTTDANNTSAGANDAAIPPTGNYTSSDPSQTSVTSFQSGGANALFANPQPGAGGWYWSATQSSSNGAVGYVRQMKTGETDGQNVTTSTGNKVRAIRREFAYDAGILDYAQAAFPSGLWWIKDRVNSNQHQLVDSVRGGNLAKTSPNKAVEGAYVAPAGSSVAWCWNLVNDRSNGFDIVTYTGNGGTQQISHQLNAVPEFMITVPRNGTFDWGVYHKDLAANQHLLLTSSDSVLSGSAWNNTRPTSTVFTVGADAATNNTSTNYVGYLWRSVPGYSAFGKYTANGTTDNAFCFTGFRPAFLLVKVIDEVTTDWMLFDSSRDPYNPNQTWLGPNRSNAEFQSTAYYHDFLSDGFKIRNSNNVLGASGKNYVWAAFAEHPMGGGNVAPSPAR